MAQATATKAPDSAATPTKVAPRQWVCEEQVSLRLFLPRISKRPRWKESGLPDEAYGAFKKGDHFAEFERWAQFVGGKFVSDDPDVQGELERIEREGLAPIYEDALAAGVYVCRQHGFTTTNPAAFAAHQRALHKGGTVPQLYDVAQDDLGVEQETPYE